MGKTPTLDDIDFSSFAAPFSLGSDCCSTVGDCLISIGLPDPIAVYRGDYQTERDALKLIVRDGGFEAAVAMRMAENGYVEDPDGFIGLVKTSLGPTACIKTGKFWMAKSADGALGYSDEHIYRRWTHPKVSGAK